MTARVPSYRLHKARNCAVVTIRGRDHYLGAYDSPESREKYHRLLAEHLATTGNPAPPAPENPLTITELVAASWSFAKEYYVKEGRPSGEIPPLKEALRFLRRLYGPTPAAGFSPLKLKALRETNEGNNLIAGPALPLSVRSLPTDGTPVNGSLSAGDRYDYYAVTLRDRESLTLDLDSTSGTRVELATSYAAAPTRVAFDARSATPGTHQEIALTAIAGGGTYYVSVYGDQLGSGASYSLTAGAAPLSVTGITPTRAGNAAPAVVTLRGAGFDESTFVEFVPAGGGPIHVNSRFLSDTTLVLDGLPAQAGVYSVQVTKGAHKLTLPNAFTVLAGGTAKLETNLVVPGGLSPGFPNKQTVWVEYRNTGDVAMPAPLLQVSVDGNGLLTTSEDLANAIMTSRTRPVGLGSSVQVLGAGSSATPGTLQPGESGRVPVYYVGQSSDHGENQLQFSLGSLTAMDTTEKVAYLTSSGERVVYERPKNGLRDIDVNVPTSPYYTTRGPDGTLYGSPDTYASGPYGLANCYQEFLAIDWTAVEAGRPDSVPVDAWQAIMLNLRANYGDLWADYDAEMARNANYLASVGQPTSDLGSLWGFEVAQAADVLSPVRYLAGAVDASAPAPGLPLTFSRVYGQDLVSRFRLGTSVVASCRRLGLDPWAYLRDVLARLPALPADRLDELLPDRWAKARATPTV